MTITKFEDLEIWQDARVLCKKIREIAENTTLFKRLFIKGSNIEIKWIGHG